MTALRYVHCVEGGFHLGATPEEVHGATSTSWPTAACSTSRSRTCSGAGSRPTRPRCPFLPDAVYNRLFPQTPGLALSPLGEALVRAMYERRVLVDISHMREDAIDETFAIVEALDRETGRDPREYPIIASHSALPLRPPAATT